VVIEIRRLLLSEPCSRSVVLDFECGESSDLYITNWVDLARGQRDESHYILDILCLICFERVLDTYLVIEIVTSVE
jgi:hypothetical protein